MQHDACGVGFIARVRGESGHDIIRHGLTALERLAHRGAPASLGFVDGCGLLTAIPWSLLTASLGGRLPAGRTRALGMVFVHAADRAAAIALVERELRASGASVAWRPVPTDRRAVLPDQRGSTPQLLQVVAAFAEGRRSTDAVLYRARLAIERRARQAGIRMAVISLSTSTVVYKALVPPHGLARFYPDLVDERFTSRFVVFHQRFSTNTSADWTLAQPFRVLAHNGEINTIAGNRAWMQARLRDSSSIGGFGDAVPVASDGSDSRTFDDAVEMLRSKGYSTAHALSRLMPPAWERDRDMSPQVRAFHEFQSLVSEPWDGPSAIAYADGRFVGAALDRNGFRPARVVRTSAELIAVASEVGVLSAAEHDIVHRGRLGAGDIVVVDLDRGVVMETNEVRRRLALARRYRQLVADTVRPLAHVVDTNAPSVGRVLSASAGAEVEPASVRLAEAPEARRRSSLMQRQIAFGCTREEIELLLKPMAAGGHEAVGSMGDDAPPAVLSSRPRLFTDFFRQRFAQVTNPPVDPYREASVMSLTTLIGAQGSYLDESATRPVRVTLRSPILTRDQLSQLRTATPLAPVTIATTFDAAGGATAFEARLDAIADEACRAVEAGSALAILTDAGIDAQHAAIPALLATAAVHQALITRGLRLRASIVVETGEARDAHQLAALCAFGASAICPSLAYDTVDAFSPADPTGCQRPAAQYRLALERGLLTILSKMGVCTFAGYCGSQLFEILGLDRALVARFFPGTTSPLGGIGLAEIAALAFERHRRAFSATASVLEYPGLHGYRRDGEYHATNPMVVRGLQKARDEGTPAYATFKSHVYNRPPSAVRDLLEFAPARAIPVDAVEPVDTIVHRFFASAMSVGALSPEAHRTIARAMNMIGARSNSGEGGEEPDRFGREDGNRTRQVASARFGVTPAYLRTADELQIKIAQGSKPGEGGQLPAVKVVAHIARLRHAQPGQSLISPPVHHDIYSIEDLAQLIHDLRTFHPGARINVKLVASTGVGIIAAGVAKAGADAIQISGHDGGTGASPRASIKHAGLPWEIGLSEAHRALVATGLRGRVVLQTDGGIKTGRDIAMAAALGADEYGFGTAALVAIGCVMARQCHANTCPVGIATQREDLRNAFTGTPEMLIGYLRLVAGEVREILASLGLKTVGALVGRSDLLRPRSDVTSPIDVSGLIAASHVGRVFRPGVVKPALKSRPTSGRLTKPGLKTRPTSGNRAPSVRVMEAVRRAEFPVVESDSIANTDRAFGAAIAGAIAERWGDRGLPDGSVSMTLTGSAGQSFGAFALPGMRLALVGDANDGLGKGMHGGDIIVAAAARERGRGDQVLIGNAALYGATGGRVFVAGRAGERFGVRNSGATAVVEGAGDHACEYMTGGTVAILGTVGRNFGAGMTGGVAYVFDRRQALVHRINPQHLTIAPLNAADQKIVRELLETHERLTGSRVARAILRHDSGLTTFVRVASAAARSAIVEPAAPAEPEAAKELTA